MYHLDILGRIDLRREDGLELRTVLAQPKRLALLVYLAVEGKTVALRRDRLLPLFWPELDQERARNSLNQAVHFLRQELGGATILSRGDGELRVAAEQLTCDVVQFGQAVERGEDEEALELYGGELLPAFYVQDAPEFERWLDETRTRLRRLAARASHTLAEQREREGESTLAVTWARRAVELSDADERAVRQLLELLDKQGDRAGALHAYAQFERRIAREFDATPAVETQALIARIRSRIDLENGNGLTPMTPVTGAASYVRQSVVGPATTHEPFAAVDSLATPDGGIPIAKWRAARGPQAKWLVLVLAGLGVTWIGSQMAKRLREPKPLLIGAITVVANTPEIEIEPAISPDGKLVAFAGATANGVKILLKQVDGGRSTVLTGELPGNHRWPRWSPDGLRLSFVADSGIYVIPALTGGEPRRIIEHGFTHSWSSDGKQIVYEGPGGLWVQVLGTGAAKRIVAGELLHSPTLSPDGRVVAFAEGRRPAFSNLSPNRVWTLPVAGGPRAPITDSIHVNVSPAWSPDGRSILYLSNAGGTRDIYQQRVDHRGIPSGRPTRVTTSLSSFTFTRSADGTRLAYDAVRNYSNVWMLHLAGLALRLGEARQITREQQTIEGMSLSHDGKWLAYDSDRNGNFDIYKLRLDGGDPVQLTTSHGDDFAPAWSPDDRQIAFHSARNGNRDIYVVDADGTRETQVTSGPREDYLPHWGADGRIVYNSQAPGRAGGAEKAGRSSIWLVKLADDGTWENPKRITPEDHTAGGQRWSPDGKLLAITWDGSLAVLSPDGGEPRVLGNRADLSGVARTTGWSADGSTVFASVDHDQFPTEAVPDAHGRGFSIVAIPRAGGPPRNILAEEQRQRFGRWEFATDGRRFFVTRAEWESDVWVMELRK